MTKIVIEFKFNRDNSLRAIEPFKSPTTNN